MPYLDLIRTAAVLMVMVYHFLPDFDLGKFSPGNLGVQLFFLLSGYLITGILLSQKRKLLSTKTMLRNFYIKRALRLFPIYYLIIIAFFALQVGMNLYSCDMNDWPYYFTYTSNILFFMEGMKGVQLNHTWSLGIEEQFYLIWPVLLLLVPVKKEGFFIFVMLLVAFGLRYFLIVDNHDLLLSGQLDMLLSGATLAWLQPRIQAINKERNISLFIVGLLLLSTYLIIDQYASVPSYIARNSIILCGVILIVGASCIKQQSAIAPPLKGLIYLGKISYGIYLYHKVIAFLFVFSLVKLGVSINPILGFVSCIVITLLVSAISYKYLEMPFLRMKKKFDL
jgi:peptidoglycan/LPS O-acetylase OafA/YrhL